VIVAATKSADDTRDLAMSLAAVAAPGDVILLSGDLGAGKTTFTQGFARGLGIEEQVTSPTFTLMRTYDAPLPLVHIDVYRLDALQEIIDLGLPEVLDDGAVALIEWGEAAVPVLPADYLRVGIEFGDGDDERRLRFETVGRSWSARPVALLAALDQWTADA
jgi:tRNA threonylcarbamoyladenosine biosynthesis protein TsaE